MNELLSGISEILDDPEAAAKIGEIAKSLLNDSQPAENSSENTDLPEAASEAVFSESQGGERKKEASESVSGLFSGFGNINFNSSDRHINLLRAIQPYMRAERSSKIDSAIKAISILKTLSNIK